MYMIIRTSDNLRIQNLILYRPASILVNIYPIHLRGDENVHSKIALIFL